MNPPGTEAGSRMPRSARLPRVQKGPPSPHSPRVATGSGQDHFSSLPPEEVREGLHVV